MVLKTIYIVRHGFRSNWVVNPVTGEYFGLTGPTGIQSDPALAGYGVIQAKELGSHLEKIEPAVDVIYSSPFYRCLQTLKPFAEKVLPLRKCGGKIRVENGVGEFYGLAKFDHPSPASLEELQTHFPQQLDLEYKAILKPPVKGESILRLHDRHAHVVARIIDDLDRDPSCPQTLLICTHAASMICLGRVLTGNMPDDVGEEDFKCFTCSLSKYERRKVGIDVQQAQSVHAELPEWREGKGVAGGWTCAVNGDCSFLSGGEERGWKFSGDESFIDDTSLPDDGADRIDMPTTSDGSALKGSRL